MAQTCNQCGKQLNDRSKFCPGCGAARLSTVALGSSVRVANAAGAAMEISAPTSKPSRRASVDAAASTSLEPADFGMRLGAWLFDLLLFLIAVMASTFLLSSFSKKSIVGSNAMLAAFYSVAVVLFAFNFIVLAGQAGQTLGKRLVGIRVVKEDGTPVTYVSVLLRHFVGYTLSALVGFLGFLWVIWDSKHQGWHDKIARTIVVLAR